MMDYNTSISIFFPIFFIGLVVIDEMYSKRKYFVAVMISAALVVFSVLWIINVVEYAKRNRDFQKQPFMNMACHN